jgi:hypothetical protein
MGLDILELQIIAAYTIYSADDEYRGSEKGVYRDRAYAEEKAIGAGWWGSNGEVRTISVGVDKNGLVYRLTAIGEFADVKQQNDSAMLKTIEAKLTPEELNFIKGKK